MKVYDVIVIGSGSIGTPTTYFLAKEGLKVLCIEQCSAPGQGQNKAAIGGVRATHSDPAKIRICQKSLEIFSHWKEETGIDIGWKKGGYCYPVYREQDEKLLRDLLPKQKKFDLNIDWVDAEKIKELVPGIVPEGLRGGTYSPDDGQASSLKSTSTFWQEAMKLGAEFLFHTEVESLQIENDKIVSVVTNHGVFSSANVVNAAGVKAHDVCAMAGLDIPVVPDCHEAAISAPVAPFLGPLVVDIRPGEDGKTSNFYFGQNSEGQIIFCYTPTPVLTGTCRHNTSEFLPIIARRMVDLVPRFKNLLIRRTWRGLYPSTPDGSSIIGKAPNFTNFYLGIGMCGQGFMMGPGTGANLASLIVHNKPLMEQEIFDLMSPSRNFYASQELLG